MTCCSRLGVEILKPLVLVVRGLKTQLGSARLGCASWGVPACWGVQVGVCKLGSARSVVGYVGMLCGVEVQVGGVQVGVCKLGCALGIHDDKCVVFSVASYSVLVGQMPLALYCVIPW